MSQIVRNRVKLESQQMDNGFFTLRIRWTEQGKRKAKSCGLGSFEVDPLEGSNSRRKGIREAVQQAEKMRADREAILIAKERGWKVEGAKDPARGRVKTFLDYMRAGRDSNARAWKNRFNIVMRRLEEFYSDPKVGLDDPCFEELTLGHGNTFRDWLKRGDTDRKPYDAESVRNYITLVKSELERAVEMGVLTVNPWRSVRTPVGNKRNTIPKEILVIDEVKTLARVDTDAPEAKRAFLVACLTGMGLSDIRALRFKDFSGGVLHYVRAKTQTGSPMEARVKLNETALKLLGKGKPNDMVFSDLPSDTAINKALDLMTRRSGIEKKITFYCGRHSFAVNQIVAGVNPEKVRQQMGQASLKTMDRYIRRAAELVEDGTESLGFEL